jgi:hypothetical protein
MIASSREYVRRCGTPCATALRRSRNLGLDPSLALQLKQLLPHRLTSELELIGELRDGGGPLALQRDENRAAAIGQLVDADDGGLLRSSMQ